MIRINTPAKVTWKRDFKPPILLLQELREATQTGGHLLSIAWERENGYVSRYDLPLPARAESCPEVVQLAERIVKFLLWSSGGWKLMLAGPRKLCQELKQSYMPDGERAFDVKFMERVYGRRMVVELRKVAEMPQTYERALLIDNSTSGCRLGFDLGASDFKISAVRRGKVVFSEEFPWDPVHHADPEYHYALLDEGLKKAAAKLPHVDAIGGSTAGVVVDNRIQVASLFRSVPAERYAEAQNMFLRLSKAWGVPVEVANDGDVTALAGLMSMGRKGILGVAMGSSEAAGFIDRRGCLTGRLSELAFAPVDLHSAAPADEWSGDTGVGVMYFSQQAVNHLALKKGVRFPAKMPLPERLKRMQTRMQDGDVTAMTVFQKIGLYLGYTVPWYREFYGFDSLMLVGRVTSGPGGVMILELARLLLSDQFPEMAEAVELFMPDEKARRVGQSVAAATLPMLGEGKAS
ncbi:MAG: ROK family protein [Verrucomicrobiota bacterium]|jgi:predicted NBD/HSP70 family sugar kinase|nr:ROK family protein [Verrucomicrobiota bacterium]